MTRYAAALTLVVALASAGPGAGQGLTWALPTAAEPEFGLQTTLQTTPATRSAPMVDMTKRSLLIGALFLPTVASGLGLAATGTPSNTILLTAHKAASVTNLYLLNRAFFDMRRQAPRSGAEVAALVAVDLLYLGTMVTGSLLTINAEKFDAVRGFHRVTPWLTILSSGVLLALLGS